MERKHAPRAEGNKLDDHEDEILQLYKDKKLDDVIKEINSKYNLHASKTQFRKRIEKWHGKKYVSQRDAQAWKQAGRKLRDRELDNKASAVIWNGRRISDPVIQRRVYRYGAPRLADKFTIDGHDTIRRFPEPSHIVIVRTPPPESTALVPSPDSYRYFRGLYDGTWHSSYMISIPLPPMLECLTQTLVLYRQCCLQNLANPVQRLLLMIPPQDSGDLMNGIRALLEKFTFTGAEAGCILQIMAFATANNLESVVPDDEVLGNLFHMVRHKTSWLKQLFESQEPMVKSLSNALIASALRRLDMAMVESCLKLGADLNPVIWRLYGSEEVSALVHSLMNENLPMAKLLYDKGIPWITSQSAIRKPVKTLLYSKGGRWLVRDDVWEFVTSSYPGALREAREFIQEEDKPELSHIVLVIDLQQPVKLPQNDDWVTLKDFEETFKESAITLAIYTQTNLSEDEIFQIVERMLSLGADPNFRCHRYNEIPVNVAIIHNYWKITGLLIDRGGVADKWEELQSFGMPEHIFNRLYPQGTYPISHAVLTQEPREFLQHILTLNPSCQKGCPRGSVYDSSLTTILTIGSFEHLNLVLASNIMPYDCQALMIAVFKMSVSRGCPGSPRLIKYLLHRRPPGADICANEGTALIFAICGELWELVTQMSEVGINLSGDLKTQRIKPRIFPGLETFEECADYEIGNGLGRSCEGTTTQDGLDWLLRFASSEAVQSAIGQGLKPSSKNLITAADFGRSDLLEVLIEHGVSRTELDAQACLQHACAHGHLETINKLLDLGVTLSKMVRTFTLSGHCCHRTAFQTAVAWDKLDVIETLIERGVDVNEPAGKVRGATALQLAAGDGNLSLVRRLIDLGADCNAPASPVNGRTALQAAAKQGRLSTVQFLLASGASTENQHRCQYIRAVKCAAAKRLSVIEKVLRDHGKPWSDEDWRIYNSLTLSVTFYDFDRDDDKFWAWMEDMSNDEESSTDGIQSEDGDTGGQSLQLLPTDLVYSTSERGETEGTGGTFDIRESIMTFPDFVNDSPRSDAIDQTGSLAHLDMIDWVDETTQHYDLYKSPGVEPELSIIPFFSNGPHNVAAELSDQFHQGTALGIDGEALQDSASNLTVSGPDLDVICAKDSSAVDTTVQHDYIWQPNPDILVPPSNIAASGSGSALESCWLDPDAAFAEDPFAVDTVAFYNSFSQPTPDIPMFLSGITASGSGSANDSRCRACGNVLEQCYCMNLLYMDGMDMNNEL